MKFNKDILPKWYSIVLWTLIILFTQGCYTQLAMFYPEPEIEQETEEQFYETYSRAVPRLSASIYAQTGAGTPLSLAYSTMHNRFNRFTGFGNRYNYYNPYFYGGYYNETYNLGGYTMRIPYTNLYAPGERKQRTFTTGRDGSSPRTNLTVTRTRSTQSNNNNSGYTNSSNVSSNRSSSTSSSTGSSSSSSSSSGGRRATRRN